jgi:hypothetical protein
MKIHAWFASSLLGMKGGIAVDILHGETNYAPIRDNNLLSSLYSNTELPT